MKRPTGRPKLAPEARVTRLACYVAPDLAAWVEREAARANLRAGPWLARLVFRERAKGVRE